MVLDSLADIPQEDQKTWVEAIVEKLQSVKNLESSVVPVDEAIKAVEAVQKSSEGKGSEKVFTIIDAFTVPK